ncbi:MAG: T9SS type A sorting domain-containing protein [Bacteroidetes bacterium]|nr:MAG: T9SS type A sorting domain-containing protein [Bacteroidota bacterium]
MKTFIRIFVIILLTNIALSEWELRYNADNVRQFASDGNKMYIGRNNGMTIYDLNTKDSVNKNTLNSELPGNYINTLMPMPDNTILVSTNGGLAVIENGTITRDKPICTNYPDNDARDLYKDSSGDIWTFSSHKVHKYSNGVWNTYDLSDTVSYKFDLLKLFIHKDKCWALFNDNTKFETVYYYSEWNREQISIAIISDTGITKIFEKYDYPYYEGGRLDLINYNNSIILKNMNGVYIFNDTNWTKTNMLDINDTLIASWMTAMKSDNKGNIWYAITNSNNSVTHPVSFNINTGLKKEHLINEEDKTISNISVLDDSTVAVTNGKYFYFYNDTGWTRIISSDYGIPDDVNFSNVRILNGHRYIIIYNDTKLYKRSTLYCLDDRSTIPPIKTGFPYSTILQFGIDKIGKGIFEGRNSQYEQLKFESDTGFVIPGIYQTRIIKPSINGKVYYSPVAKNGSYLLTWEGNKIDTLDLGFMNEISSFIYDFDVYEDKLIALGYYEYDTDSLNTFLSIYNTSTGELLKYDKTNSQLPDFYYRTEWIMKYSMDTVPICLTVGNGMNIWITTTESLIEFNNGNMTFYELPKKDTFDPIVFSKIYFDSASNEIFASSYYDSFYFFDLATEKWDSIPKSDCGIIGWYISHKKLLDGRIWACDYTGYMYRYIGKGKFEPYNLQINGREYLNFQINDFSIDANNYLHLGTDIGLLTNKTILTGIEDNTFIDTEQIFLMPNPATDYLYIKSNILRSSIEIYSILGNKVLESEYKDRIDVSGLSAGVYFLKAGDKVYKFVKI